jgi:hypothetical protein
MAKLRIQKKNEKGSLYMLLEWIIENEFDIGFRGQKIVL